VTTRFESHILWAKRSDVPIKAQCAQKRQLKSKYEPPIADVARNAETTTLNENHLATKNVESSTGTKVTASEVKDPRKKPRK